MYSIPNGPGANSLVSVAVSLVGPAKRDGASVFGFSSASFSSSFFPGSTHHIGPSPSAPRPSSTHHGAFDQASNHCHSLVIKLRSTPWETYAKISSISSLISPSIYEAVTAPSS